MILTAALAAMAPASMQQATPTPSAPVSGPTITTIPPVVPERFTLGPPAATPTPRPSPTTTERAEPVAAPTPAAVPAREPAVRSRQPVPAQRPVPVPVTQETQPVAVAPPTMAPEPEAVPSPVVIPAETAPAATAPAEGGSPLFWALLGAGATALAGLAGWLILRRRRPGIEEAAYVEEAVAPPVPARAVLPPAIPPVAAPPPTAPIARPVPNSAVAPAGNEPFEITPNPSRIEFEAEQVMVDIELLIGNAMPSAAEGIRLSVVLMSANPNQDSQIVAFSTGPQLANHTEAFDLAQGSGGRLPVRLALPRDRIHVVEVGGRPMFVPLVMVDLRWRSGLSIRRFGASFLIGVAGQGGKLGPIWLDRAAPAGPLAANRYIPRARAAAA